jgi:hypothetical protein
MAADWLKKVVDETNKQFDELPEWKKTVDQKPHHCSKEERTSSTIREPNTEPK